MSNLLKENSEASAPIAISSYAKTRLEYYKDQFKTKNLIATLDIAIDRLDKFMSEVDRGERETHGRVAPAEPKGTLYITQFIESISGDTFSHDLHASQKAKERIRDYARRFKTDTDWRTIDRMIGLLDAFLKPHHPRQH